MKLFMKIWIGITIVIAVFIIFLYLSSFLISSYRHPPEKCALEEELSCDTYTVYYDEKEIMLDIHNGYEDSVKINSLSISKEENVENDSLLVCNSQETNVVIKPGLKKEVRFYFDEDCELIEKMHAKYLLQLEINKVDMGLDRMIEGDLVAKSEGYVYID